MPAENKANETWICLGRVIRPHGVRGALSVKLENPQSEAFQPGLQLRFEMPKGQLVFRRVRSFQAGRILSLEGLEDRDLAEEFNQAKIWVKRSDLPDLQEDEIYLGDMIGFQVLDEEGQTLGVVEGFSHNTAQLLLDLRLSSGSQAMIPYVAPLVKSIDQERKKITVDLPEGLLEIEKKDA